MGISHLYSRLGSFCHVVRFGYRQKHRVGVLCKFSMIDENHQPVHEVDELRKQLCGLCEREHGDNHETYAIMLVNPNTHKVHSSLFVTFSDAVCYFHTEAPDQDGGEPHGTSFAMEIWKRWQAEQNDN